MRVCIHPDLVCNHHPDCDNAEDEEFEVCYGEYVRKGLVDEFATLKCPSKIYPDMITVATVCDGIEECYGGEDEPKTCLNSNGFIFLGVSLATLLGIYLTLKLCIILRKKSTKKKKESKVDWKFKKKVRNFCLHAYHSFGNEARRKVGLIIFALEEKRNGTESELYRSLHNNYEPEVAKMIIDAKYPGIISRHFNVIRIFMECITNILKEKKYGTVFSGKLVSLVNQYSDTFKDCFLLYIMIEINGGPTTLLEFPMKFSSIVIMTMAVTIAGPIFISSLQLATNNPGLVFNSKKTDKWTVMLMRIGVILLSLVNPLLLNISYDEINEKIRKQSGSSRTSKLKEMLRKRREIMTELSRFTKVDLSLELIYQISLQLSLVLLSRTVTPTTGGLEVLFEQADVFGISGSTVIIILTCWSFKCCILLQLKTIISEKVLVPFSSKMVILIWSTAAYARRIMAILVFFLPSLGLFDILVHWKAEQLPFDIRLGHLQDMSPKDIIHLNSMNREVLWTDIDRWEYSSSKHDYHQPPHYSLYTGLALGETFVAFLVLTALHLIVILIVKIITVKKIKRENIVTIFVHILENLNIPSPYKEWDSENLIVSGFKEKLKEVNREMLWSFFVNIVFNVLMFMPLWWTGTILLNIL